MKILVAHNAYQHRGGEDVVVEAEIALLRRFGHEVEVFALHNDALNGMSRPAAAVAAIWSQQSAAQIHDLCDRFRPDVIHVHNTFPLISPSLYWAASKHDVPVVQTLHNFRLLCPQAIFLRDGKICEDCVGRLPWRAVTRKCYRGSAVQSAVITTMLATHRAIGTYRERVTRYIALNRFARDKYIEGGLPAERFRIKPNFVQAAQSPSWETRSGGLYVGRLSQEKGIGVLNAAMRSAREVTVEVIGGGPMEAPVREVFGERYLGVRTLDEIMARMGKARFLVLPSICYENSPRTIVEAFACGLPVIASRLGALADMVHDGVTGLLFNPADPADLARKMDWAAAHPEQMARMGCAARADYDAQYTPERNYEMLMDIYEDAISARYRESRAAQGRGSRIA
ncbi:MAG TPA: glycosyltransferase family 4 protein [Noviherbaspirillum sp.]|uniref:glycosyltransferase family 4 protein n=1 Tax=Noviherbaspirillum sp. TaxID=1926288 RepID=UPI002B481639|nr:glycosyltransferase family 4 protein [Noviherbaspirillum sp.]HJV86995.1 glycosyltransferase family 4 protein [Noviherbaspirillum sp.]